MRLFVGLPVQDSELAEAAAILARHGDIRLVPEGTWHVTLRFLGDVSDAGPVAAALRRAVAGMPALPYRLVGLGGFPSAGQARVAWAGVEAPGIRALAQKVQTETALYGDPPEARPFHAHVTLGRNRLGLDLRHDQAHVGQRVWGEGRLSEVVLWKSELGPGGPTYTPVERFSLDQAVR